MRAFCLLITAWAMVMSVPRLGRAQVSNEVLLVLEVRENERFSGRLTQHLEKQLERTGHQISPTAKLRPEQRLYRDERHLIELSQETRSRLLLWGEVRDSGDGRRGIELWLFDASAPASGGQYDFQRCRAEQLDEILPQLAERILATLHKAPSAPPAKPAPPPPPKSAELRKRGLPPWRIGLAVSLGGLGIGLLSGAIVLHTQQGKPNDNAVCLSGEQTTVHSCVNNNTGLLVGGYALTGLAAVGAWLAVALPST